jgi:His/Glu/Gln/Arg/opine family amino acid ABC transporter permease subunit
VVFVAPELLPQALGDWLKALPNAPFVTAVICLGFFTSARVAVQVARRDRGAAGGQRLAGAALGLTLPQTYRFVLLPLAVRIILPPLTSEFLNIIKNSSVALTIGLMELTASARAMQEFSFQVFEAFSAATLIYVLVNLVVIRMRWLERRLALPGTRESACMFAQFRLRRDRRSWVYLFQVGMAFTLELTVLAMLGGVIVLAPCWHDARLSRLQAAGAPIAAAYVNLIRSVPLVLVIFWFYFLVPYMAAWMIGAAEPVKVGAFWSALITFTLFEAAYYCEIMRGGIQSMPRGRSLAAQALGMNYWQAMG